MTKEEAAKIAQAYQWLAEGKEVECTYLTSGRGWKTFDGSQISASDFRIKPELLNEYWVTISKWGDTELYDDKDLALRKAATFPEVIDRVMHLREVREEDVK